MASCKKETSNTVDNVFTETKDNVQRNEPVLLSFGDNATAQTVIWKCEPSTNVTLNNVGAYTTAIFANAGSYTVTALNGNKQATFNIVVNNNIYDEFAGKIGISASKVLRVGINENVDFTVHNAGSNISQLNWSSQSAPATIVGYSNNNSTITYNFQSPGAKYVTFSNGNFKETRTIWVDDSVYSNTRFSSFILFDKLNITPSFVANGISKNLVFNTKTTYNYQCSSDFIIGDAFNFNNTLILSYGGVGMSSIACSNIEKASISNSFTNIRTGSTYPFSINYQNKTFNGSVSIDSSGLCNINFTDNNFISINPKKF